MLKFQHQFLLQFLSQSFYFFFFNNILLIWYACKKTAMVQPTIIGVACIRDPYRIYIAFATSDINLNLYSPFADIEIRLVVKAIYPILSINNVLMFYLFSGEIFLYFDKFFIAFSKFFGRNTLFVDAGYFSIIFSGLIGLSTKLPEQLGHTFLKMAMAHSLQYVHSKEQIIASIEIFGNSLSQCSQLGLMSNIWYMKRWAFKSTSFRFISILIYKH